MNGGTGSELTVFTGLVSTVTDSVGQVINLIVAHPIMGIGVAASLVFLGVRLWKTLTGF